MTLFKTKLGVGRDKQFVNHRTSMHNYRMNVLSEGLDAEQAATTADANKFIRQDRAIRLQQNQSNVMNMISESNEVYKELKVNYLVNTLSEVFLKALPLDSYYITENASGIRKLFGQELAKLSESPEKLLESMRMSNSSYLRDVANNVLSEAKKDTIEVQEKVSKDKDPEEFEKAKSEKSNKAVWAFGTEDASELIKDKVLAVLDDENKNSEKEKEIQDELNAKGLSEGYTVNFNSVGDKVRHYSLFRAMQIDCYKKAAHTVGTLNESTAMASNSGEGIKFNTDAILAECVVKYTLLETFNTLGLKKFDSKSATKLSDEIVYRNYNR